MAIETIDVGSTANDGTGDDLRTAMGKINQNFENLYGRLDVSGVDYTGSADSTSAIQAALDAAGDAGGGVVRLSSGLIKITSTLRISDHRVHLVGAGPYATTLVFAPIADDTCIEVNGGGTVLYQGSIRDMTIYSNNGTYTKIAIDIVDTSGWIVENVVIGGSVVHDGTSYWSGDSSIGIRTQGREFNLFRDLYISADQPICVGPNPNHTISADHFHFTNSYLLAHEAPCVTIFSGVNLTQCTFDGANPWVRGTYGLYWNDTETVGASNGLTLKNVRSEQGTDSDAYMFYIAHNSNLQGLVIENCYGGSDRNGIYLRKVWSVSIIDHFHAGTTVALNVDSTVDHVTGRSCYWLAGSTLADTMANMGQRLMWATPKNPTTGALPPNFVMQLDTNLRNFTVGGALGETTITLDDGDVLSLGSAMAGHLFVTDSEGWTATFACSGTNNTVVELADTSTIFSATKDTASSTNVYYDSGYKIQNKRGESRTYRTLLIGSYDVAA